MLIVAVDRITPRIRYVFDRIKDFRQIEIELIENQPNTNIYRYSQNLTKTEIGLKASPLLYNEELVKEDGIYQETLCFSEISDPLASVFYHLSRMEEYNYSNYDKHGRFQAKDSFVEKYGLGKKLMTERWIDAFLHDYEKQTNTNVSTKKTPLKFTLTFDIDNAYAFNGKPFSRQCASLVKDVIRLDFVRFSARISTLLGLRKDPYDTYQKMEEYTKKTNLRLFWLLGDYGTFDKNLPNNAPKHLRLIQKLGQKFSIGLHPSYGSNTSDKALSKEKNILDKTLNTNILSSRQHFLKLQFPTTYQRNINAGFQEDFTLGFGDKLAFRAGTLQVFPFFDLTKNQKENYLIFPFAYMDGTLKDYLHLSVEESKKEIQELINEAQLFGGNFIAIWHNETISEWHNWRGWTQLIDYTIAQIHEVRH